LLEIQSLQTTRTPLEEHDAKKDPMSNFRRWPSFPLAEQPCEETSPTAVQGPIFVDHILTDEQVHDAKPLFKQYPFNNCKTILNNLKEKLAVEAPAIEFDHMELDWDTAHFP
jgi:hypothetical protein